MRFFSSPQTFAIGAGLLLTLHAALATDPSYINSGSVTNPTVDATSFLNQGYFEVSKALPYETSNTLYHTNRGTMTGSVGFRFNFFTSGNRKRSFYFDNESTITATDPTSFVFFNGNLTTSFASYLYVNATNIVNRGTMQVGSSGLLQLTGNKIDLRGGALVASSELNSDQFLDNFNAPNASGYFTKAKISYLYWGVGTNNTFDGNGGGIGLGFGRMDTNSSAFGSGSHQVIEAPNYFTNFTQIPEFFFSGTNFGTNFTSPGFLTFCSSNRLSPNSSMIQAVFVSTNAADPNMKIDARFSAGPDGRFSTGPGGRYAVVQFSVDDTNILTAQKMTSALYFSDATAVATNLFYQTNYNARTDRTLRANVYDLTLSTPSEWVFSTAPTNINYTPSLLYDPIVRGDQDPQPDNIYAAQSIFVGSVIDTNTLGSSVLNEPTNSVGRVEIIGDDVNMNLSRVRSEGLLTITATNFQTLQQGATLQAEQMKLNLTSTNATFILTNILSKEVRRIGGTLRAYSCLWTNSTASGETNLFHVLLLENNLLAVQPTKAYGFSMRVNNTNNPSIIIEDPLTVAREFYLDAKNVTIRADINVSDSITAANIPTVYNFTNEGAMTVPNSALFSRATGPLTSFVNRSNILANSISVNAQYFQNTGIIGTLTGSLSLTNPLANTDLANGLLASTVDLNLRTDQLRASNSVLTAGYIMTNVSFFGQTTLTYNLGGIFMSANSLYDSELATNRWESLNGFQLLKINSGGWIGDLLHTELKSTVKPSGFIDHKWSSSDKGVVKSGFTNNAALGKLILDTPTLSQFRFSGPSTTTNWAMYVDYLDLRNYATNWQNTLQLEPNFRIYFADSSVRPEKLDKVNNLYWVRNYAGRYSGTNVVINGQVVRINRALYTSVEIDSDGDGSPNGQDSSPFDGVSFSQPTIITNTSPKKVTIPWMAAADTTYSIEYKTNLTNSVWTVLTNLTTSASGPASVTDTISGGQRFYRVRYTP